MLPANSISLWEKIHIFKLNIHLDIIAIIWISQHHTCLNISKYSNKCDVGKYIYICLNIWNILIYLKISYMFEYFEIFKDIIYVWIFRNIWRYICLDILKYLICLNILKYLKISYMFGFFEIFEDIIYVWIFWNIWRYHICLNILKYLKTSHVLNILKYLKTSYMFDIFENITCVWIFVTGWCWTTALTGPKGKSM